jgi:uncharacterized protein (TIGR02001 family)
MKPLLKKVALAATISCALSSQAFAGASANIGVMSDYVWRGMTQNGGDAALMGGFDYEMDNGLYVGTWAANADNDGDQVEVDFYAGFSKELSGGFGYDIGVVAYIYPGAENLDFTEVYLNASYGPVEIGVANTVSADDTNIEGDIYTHLTLSKDMGPFGVSATAGNYDFDAGGDQQDYQLAASYEIPKGFGELTGAVDWLSTAAGDDSRVGLTWSKGFDF